MPREASAGGVVIRESDGALELAAIRPRGKEVWALPKGHVDPGETPEEAAAREVQEETGLQVELVGPLGDIRYIYQFGGKKIFKQVYFFLFRCTGGEINQLDPKMRVEVERAKWVPLKAAPKVLAYRGEREVVGRAISLLGQRAAEESTAGPDSGKSPSS